MEQLQTSSSQVAQHAIINAAPQALKEPRIGLLDKFDGTCSKFRGFVNQVRLLIRMQPLQYPIKATQVGLIGTLLSEAALVWYSPLEEKILHYSKIWVDFLMNSSILLEILTKQGRQQ